MNNGSMMKRLNTMARWRALFFRQSMISLSALVLVLSMGMGTNVARAVPRWPIAPYTYFANGETLRDVLQKFASGFSLSLHLSPGVRGLVNGKFTAASPTEFMDKLGGVYGFSWFVYAGTLFISPAQAMITQTVNVGTSIRGLRQALERLGVLDDRFGWGELQEQGLALVSGPPDYVKLIEKTIKSLPLNPGRQQVEVFRLKYATVSDRSVKYRDKTILTPGLETILRKLIDGTGSTNGNNALAALAAPLRTTTLATLPSLASPQDDSNGASSGTVLSGGGTRSSAATIQADARLNALIVQDIPERMPIYRALIAQLDVPSTLIEIEAMIVDVQSSVVNTLGIQWGARAGVVGFGFGDAANGIANKDISFPFGGKATLPTLKQGQMGFAVGSNLVAKLDALQQDGLANILTRPSILTTDNIGSVIDVTNTYYAENKSQYVANVTPITTGTLLRVTPRYLHRPNSDQVELTLEIEDGTFVAPDTRMGTSASTLPVVAKTNIDTLATVANGQTLLIGGYRKKSDQKNKKKVPILGDIPLLGALFSSKDNNSSNLERLIIIRPRVIAVNGKPYLPPAKWGDASGLTWEDKKSALKLNPAAVDYLHFVQSTQDKPLRRVGKGNTSVKVRH